MKQDEKWDNSQCVWCASRRATATEISLGALPAVADCSHRLWRDSISWWSNVFLRAEIRTGPFALSSFWPNPGRILQDEFPLGRGVVEICHQQVFQVRG